MAAIPATSDAPTGSIFIIFTDIVNSTSLWEFNETAMSAALALHNSIIREKLMIFGGYEVKTLGDGFYISVKKATHALHLCLTLQQALRSAHWPAEILDYYVRNSDMLSIAPQARDSCGISVRMSIHYGNPFHIEINPVTNRVDYHGKIINSASRLESAASADEIAVSDAFIVELYHTQTGKRVQLDELDDSFREIVLHREFSVKLFTVIIKGPVYFKGMAYPEYVTLIHLQR